MLSKMIRWFKNRFSNNSKKPGSKRSGFNADNPFLIL